MQRLSTVTLLDVSAVAGHHAMPAALLLHMKTFNTWAYIFPEFHNHSGIGNHDGSSLNVWESTWLYVKSLYVRKNEFICGKIVF